MRAKRSDSLDSRIAKLERSNRLLLGFSIACIAAISVGMTLLPSHQVVEASSFVLRDSQGAVRCVLACDKSGAVTQTFIDGTGQDRLRLTVDESNVARIRLFDDRGSPRVGLFAYPQSNEEHSDVAGVGLIDRSGVERSLWKTDKDDLVSLVMLKERADARLALAVKKGGDSLMHLADKDHTRVSCYSMPTQAGLSIYDANGKERLMACATASGVAADGLLDSEGNIGLARAIDANGKAGSKCANGPLDDVLGVIGAIADVHAVSELAGTVLGGF